MVVPDGDPGRLLVRSDETDVSAILIETLTIVVNRGELASKDCPPD
jgi:hypothetical protein